MKAWNAVLERDIEKDARPSGRLRSSCSADRGDDLQIKTLVASLFDSMGYDVVAAGALAEGWRFERARPAYCMPLDRAALEAKLAEAR